ncbi:ferritin heavy chain B-like [Amyelois transitella]|uniref:ferritin heavy chain B-like n=1 Tax=Amyelois transitella TaxID=680683 RepID=UPI00298F8511|nr:ferritin heavy chain B-like [Amyelois transitella]
MIKNNCLKSNWNYYMWYILNRLNHTSAKSNSPFHYKYTPGNEVAINKQIQIEQQAAQEYLNIAVKFLQPCQLWPGAAGFFMRMYEEELRHMQLFILYQLRRGGTPIISSLKEPLAISKLSLLDAFQKALEMEKCVTKSLEDLVVIAEKDFQCVDFVTSRFLSEQISSIDELAQHIVNLCKLSDNEHSLYHYDLQLSKRYPYTYLKL